MENIIAAIKDHIEECKRSGAMFTMPVLDGCSVSKQELPCSGTALIHCAFTVLLPDGRTICIDYQSKDKSKTFSMVPDRSCIRVESSDHKNDFSATWDEK